MERDPEHEPRRQPAQQLPAARVPNARSAIAGLSELSRREQAELIVGVAECFTSVQGEGVSAGEPANFLRLQGCSVGCRWCDSRYTWPQDGGEQVGFEEIAARFDRLGRARLLVLTGGEPLENPAFASVVAWASRAWRRVEIETSGLLAPPTVPANVAWNWSPKLSSVTQRSEQTWSHAPSFRASPNWVCKVVVDGPDDWQEAVTRIQENRIPAERVLVMPQGITPEVLADRGRWLVPLCIKQGYRLSTRLHIHLWGPKRGV